MAAWCCARVWDSGVLLRFREMACMRHENVMVTREPRSRGDHHFERCCILRTVQPTQTHGRRRKLTPPQPPTFQSHWSRPSSSMGYHTTHEPGPLQHCQVQHGDRKRYRTKTLNQS
ncbi:uncharacterized protein LOC143902590 [Temnothorax americanus]|uniref:uncharacterized protein LOC143902590 n=1 Tax=Temnothorax americanus TaxID=1964332 RepID=UPI004068D258